MYSCNLHICEENFHTTKYKQLKLIKLIAILNYDNVNSVYETFRKIPYLQKKV